MNIVLSVVNCAGRVVSDEHIYPGKVS